MKAPQRKHWEGHWVSIEDMNQKRGNRRNYGKDFPEQYGMNFDAFISFKKYFQTNLRLPNSWWRHLMHTSKPLQKQMFLSKTSTDLASEENTLTSTIKELINDHRFAANASHQVNFSTIASKATTDKITTSKLIVIILSKKTLTWNKSSLT